MQRQLLNALLAALATTALVGALLPLAVLADSSNVTTCDKAGYPEDNKVDAEGAGPFQVSGDWGSATWDDDDDRSLDIDMNDGWTVEICIKYGGGVAEYTVNSDQTITVERGISHVSWMDPTPPPPITTPTTSPPTTTPPTTSPPTTSPPTTEGSTTSTSQPTTTTTNDPTTTTTVASSTTSTSDPATTTSTTDPITTSTIQSSSSTTTSEVSPATLPFTGPTDGLPILALSLLATGTLIVAATRKVEDV